MKQFTIDNEFLLVLAEEKSSEDFWQLNEVHERTRERLVRAGNLGFKVLMSHVRRSKDKLCRDGFIEVKGSKTNPEEHSVELTLWGLFRVLEGVFEETLDDALRERLGKIACNQGGKLLPFVFNPYNINRELGQKVLRSYFEFYPKGYHYMPEYRFVESLTSAGFKEMTKKEVESMRLESFYDYVFLINPEISSLPEEEMKLWNALLVHDEEARKYIIERLRFYRDRYMPKLEVVNQRLNFFEDN
jgi:hypothetical protein